MPTAKKRNMYFILVRHNMYKKRAISEMHLSVPCEFFLAIITGRFHTLIYLKELKLPPKQQLINGTCKQRHKNSRGWLMHRNETTSFTCHIMLPFGDVKRQIKRFVDLSDHIDDWGRLLVFSSHKEPEGCSTIFVASRRQALV